MLDLTMASLLPILIASVTATCFSYIFSGSDALFNYHMDSTWDIQRVPPYILLGVFCGFVGLYFMRLMTACENTFTRMKRYPGMKIIVGGLLLSVLIFFFPSLYGEGYNQVDIFLSGETMAD